MKKLNLFVSTTLLALTISAQALVKGGQFKDRILPMQGSVTKSDGQTIWGASGVQERFLDNGAEPKTLSNGKPDVSYWGGNVVKDAAGLYLMFLAGWDATKKVIGGRFFALQSEASSSVVIIIRPDNSAV